MIKTNEIRRGNWFHHNSEWCYFSKKTPDNSENLAFDFQWVESDWVAHLTRCELELKNVSPIPLTEDWLLRFGFEHIQFAYNFNESNWRIFKIGGFCVGEKDGKFAWYNEADDDYYSTYYPIFLHVHHLQNFYFAYSQKELEIK